MSCEWTNCPRRVGNLCCEEKTFDKPNCAASPQKSTPMTKSERGQVVAALLIARRYVLTNPEQHATIAAALNIMRK